MTTLAFQLHITVELLKKSIMKSTAAACLPAKYYFEKEIDLTKKNTGKPSHQVDFQCSHTKISEHKGVLENEIDAAQKTNKNPSHLADYKSPFNMIAFQTEFVKLPLTIKKCQIHKQNQSEM